LLAFVFRIRRCLSDDTSPPEGLANHALSKQLLITEAHQHARDRQPPTPRFGANLPGRSARGCNRSRHRRDSCTFAVGDPTSGTATQLAEKAPETGVYMFAPHS
jgi:hypothetical protein